MRIKLFLIALCLALLIVACDDTTIVVTATPESVVTEDPTPTQEVLIPTNTPDPLNGWDVSCVEEGQVVLNQNPCLSGGIISIDVDGVMVEFPTKYSVWYEKNPDTVQAEIVVPPISYKDGGFLVNMHYWQGYVGLRFAPFYPEAGICYLLIVDIFTNVNSNDYHASANNYYTVARIHPDDGAGPITLSEQPWVNDYNQPWSKLDGKRTFLFPLYTLKSNEVWLIDVGIRSIWGIGGDGTYARFDSIRMVKPNDNGHCANMPGL